MSDWLADLRAAEKAATPGPWHADDEHADLGPDAVPAWCVSRVESDGRYLHDVAYTTGTKEQLDAELIAVTRNALPDLLAAAEERDRLAKAIRDWRALPAHQRLYGVDLLAVIGETDVTGDD